jgi:hypothetical protein
MTDTFKTKLPDSIWQLSPYRSERLDELLSLMNVNKQVSGILLGGSFSYKDDFAKSDVDLFCLIDDANNFETELNQNLSRLNDIDEIIFQGSFPWTEKLYTIYFKRDIDFSIDLCLINSDKAEKFFWEPDGYILFDKENIISNCRTMQMNRPEFTRQPFLKSNPFSLSVVTLKKIEKNISRNHLWNALEQLNSLRRYVMQIIRLAVVKHNYFLGRVDRDIEDVIPNKTNQQLKMTVAIYNSKDIAQKAVMLIEILLELKDTLTESNEKKFQDWIIKQLKHEQIKLSSNYQ